MFKVDEIESVVKEMFSRFFADLLLRIGVSVNVQLSPDAKKKARSPTATGYISTWLHSNICRPLSNSYILSDVEYIKTITVNQPQSIFSTFACSLCSY